MSILHYYLGRPAHVWIAMSRRSPASPRPASPARLDHGGQSESARAVSHLTSQASRNTYVLPRPARPTPRTNRNDVTS